MALWCRNFPLVSSPGSDEPKRVTFVVPYYSNPEFFARQIATWTDYPANVSAHLSVIVVDDGSPEAARLPAHVPFNLRLFRIETDIRWNWLAARNIGAHHAADGWLLLTDMDHVVPVQTLQAIVWGLHDPKVVYAFSRREYTGEAIHPHSASFLMTRELFWKIGGYDEALSGHYGTDGIFRRQIELHARIHVLTDELIRYEYVDDSSTTRYGRKQPEDAAVARIVAARKPGWKPKILSFPYHQVMPREACA
jgi:hypothetical protein